MKTKLPQWKASDTSTAKYLGSIVIPDGNEDAQPFEVLSLADRLVFGNPTNACFLESGYILREDGESEGATLCELVADLETFYSDGRAFTSRIVCNDRM